MDTCDSTEAITRGIQALANPTFWDTDSNDFDDGLPIPRVARHDIGVTLEAINLPHPAGRARHVRGRQAVRS